MELDYAVFLKITQAFISTGLTSFTGFTTPSNYSSATIHVQSDSRLHLTHWLQFTYMENKILQLNLIFECEWYFRLNYTAENLDSNHICI